MTGDLQRAFPRLAVLSLRDMRDYNLPDSPPSIPVRHHAILAGESVFQCDIFQGGLKNTELNARDDDCLGLYCWK